MTTNHRSDVVGLNYIYPVISRRTGGLSIGINFNTNNACNWHCIYCQVPNLKKGAAPDINLKVLGSELEYFLDYVINGNFYDNFGIEKANRKIMDIAIAGDGEPTSLKQFPEALRLIGSLGVEAGVLPESRFILITNGSLMHQTKVQQGLQKLNEFNGEVWFKLDSATEEGREFINNSGQGCQMALKNLIISAQICMTKIQTCVFSYNGEGISLTERNAMLSLLKTIRSVTRISHVMLYTIARPSMQPESSRLGKLPISLMNEFAKEIESLGFYVTVND